jgi:apolipoprotein D and lipocalin family protein
MKPARLFLVLVPVGAYVLFGCVSRPPLPTAGVIDLPRFMGSWYVVGHTPLLVDKQAYNAVEHYALAEDGRILTTYQFRDGSVDGRLKTYKPTGFVHDPETRAEWRMQFVWPFKAAYTVLYLSDDGQHTIIAHPNRKYAWIMSRSPAPAEEDYEAMLDRLEQAGFDRSRIRRVPHDWSAEGARLDAMGEAGSTRPLAPR